MRSKKEIKELMEDCEKSVQKNLQRLRNTHFTKTETEPILNVIQMDEKTRQVLQWVLSEVK